jgi:hypothetical protein
MLSRRSIKLILILLMALLIAYLWFNNSRYTCNECKMTFKNTKVMGAVMSNPDLLKIDINATDLFKEFAQGECAVRWSRTRGYYES